MRFDDTLATVLSADLTAEGGRASAWRQLVDLLGRGRIEAEDRAVAALNSLRDGVPLAVRAASARAIDPVVAPQTLTALLATDATEVAVPVLRDARMDDAAWVELLPRLTPSARTVLRNRRDLSPAVMRALASFGPVDLVLPDPGQGSQPEPESEPSATDPVPEPAPTQDGGYRIVDVMARLDAFERSREVVAPVVGRAEGFRFATDAAGVVRRVDGVSRGSLVGLPLALGAAAGIARVDGVAGGALARRAAFRDARLTVEGEGEAAGEWRLSGTPAFDAATGRFTGYHGHARRPRRDERSEPAGRERGTAQLRQLVHELRTPAGAIAGFAEMIEAQLLGPVPAIYRERASEILSHSRELVAVIDDLDLAARIDGDALDLREDRVRLDPLIGTIAADLASLAALRASSLCIEAAEVAVAGDRRAVERLLARLLATLVSASGPEEAIHVRMGAEGDGQVAVVMDRPAMLDAWPGDAIFDIDDAEEDGTLLGTGFALRLARNLATELGGALQVGHASLTLRLPEAQIPGMEQASTR